TLSLTLLPFYPTGAEPPAGARLRVTLVPAGDRGREPAAITLAKLPLEHSLPIKDVREGDHTLRTEIVVGDRVLAVREQTVSLAARLDERLARLKKAVEAFPKEPASTDQETARSLVNLLDGLRQKKTPETNYPAARLLAEAEAAAAAVAEGKTYYGGG